ncbi:MAG: hypothetical protein K2Y27_15935 [Xanthobacteraceae bacterium]|nr:hypothetical protein [Xanthobacteraceae bacterium]
MKKADEYRRHANEALTLMSKFWPSGRKLLRDVARAWLSLARAADASATASHEKASERAKNTPHQPRRPDAARSQ